MPLLLLLALFVAVPILEIYLIIQVGQAIGVLPTIALLIADSILGTMLMRSQGRLAWRRFQAAIAEGRPPAREVVDGALVILGGALLLAPGFATDILGVLLLLPPTRAIVRPSACSVTFRDQAAAVRGRGRGRVRRATPTTSTARPPRSIPGD